MAGVPSLVQTGSCLTKLCREVCCRGPTRMPLPNSTRLQASFTASSRLSGTITGGPTKVAAVSTTGFRV